MNPFTIVIAAALTFGICYFVDKGYTKLFRDQQQHKTGLQVRVSKRYASIGLLEYFDAVGYDLECAIAKNVYPDLCDTKDIQPLILEGFASGKTGQAAGEGLYDWSKKDADDFRRRKQSPYFDGVREWTMPE